MFVHVCVCESNNVFFSVLILFCVYFYVSHIEYICVCEFMPIFVFVFFVCACECVYVCFCVFFFCVCLFECLCECVCVCVCVFECIYSF